MDKKNKKETSIKKEKEIILLLEKEKEEYLNGWKRAKADLINYKRDETLRTDAALRNGKKSIILKIISVMDSFDRAFEEISKDEKDAYFEGFLKIKEQMEGLLTKEGVEKIETVDKEFDPFFHEVVESVKKEGISSGIIIEETQKGYIMDGEVIRPSKVKVAL